MEITKKQWTIIGVVIALIAIWYFFLRKKKAPESNYKAFATPFRGTVYNPYPNIAGHGTGPRIKVVKGNAGQDPTVRGG